MATKYKVDSHEVEVSRIAQVQPLWSSGQMHSPDAGLRLVLDDESRLPWLAENDSAVPGVGDYVVRDHLLHVTYVIGAENFSKLFHEDSDAKGI